jgi:hypothetical protein
MRFQSHLTHQFLEESKRPLTIQTNGFPAARQERHAYLRSPIHYIRYQESLGDANWFWFINLFAGYDPSIMFNIRYMS